MPEPSRSVTRRHLLQGAAVVASNLTLPFAHAGSPSRTALPDPGQPDLLFAYLGDAEPTRHALVRRGTAWTGNAPSATVRVTLQQTPAQTAILLECPAEPIQRLHLRWQFPLPVDTLALGDAWERSYGDLAWRTLEPERPLPWYFLLHGSTGTVGMGVKTGSASFAFWQADAAGISLWLDVRNGGNGVFLGNRPLAAASLVTVSGAPGETAFAVTRRLCQAMAAGTARPTHRGGMPVDILYGSNDWYYAYGQNTPAGLLRDADLVASLAPAGAPKPFTVIDDGYQDPVRFPSMPRLAQDLRSRGVHPGLWIRPLRATAATPPHLLLPAARWSGPAHESAPSAYDPTAPAALQAIAAVAAQAAAWGYDLIKHDFTTWELFGQWGSQMGASPTRGNWRFHDRTRTNAEIVTALYRELRTACGEDRIILGCNTVGHLSVGIFDTSRTGDDTSGRDWERTRRTGVNTLAFRLPQHGAFFSIDADCVALTPDVPWSMSRQWLDLVARSGTVLLVSPDPRSIGAAQRQALREAFATSSTQPATQPLDWLQSRTPAAWRDRNYQWILESGESPFPLGIQRGPD